MAKVINKVEVKSKKIEIGSIVRGEVTGDYYMVTQHDYTDKVVYLINLNDSELYMKSESLEQLQTKMERGGYDITGIKQHQVKITFE